MQHSLDSKNSFSSLRVVILIWKKLRKKRKFQLTYLLLLMITSSLAELFSLASVIPFLGVITDSDSIWKIDYIKNFSISVGISNSSDLIIPFTIIFVISSFLAAIIRLSNIWFNYKLAALIGTDLSLQAYNLTLNQPYESHLTRNSSEVITTLSRQIDYTVIVIGFALQLITSFFVVLGLLLALFLTNWKVALSAGFTVGSIYIVVIKKTKRFS